MICAERQNRMLASQATLMQVATATTAAMFSKDGGKGAYRQFKNVLSKLTGGGDPASQPEKKSMADLVRKGR